MGLTILEILQPTFQVQYKDKTTFAVELISFSVAIRTFYVQYRQVGKCHYTHSKHWRI